MTIPMVENNLTRHLQNLANSAAEKVQSLYRPIFFRLEKATDRARLEELLATKPHISVHDNLTSQLGELIKIRNPQRTFNFNPDENELDYAIAAYLAGRDPGDYGVWVYYPWAERLVHLVDETEFIELRTSRNQHKITRAERDTLATKRIGVVGLSVGQSVALSLALERSVGELRLADFDRLELTNLNRIRTGVYNLGVPKVIATAREIAEIDPFLKVICYPDGLTPDNLDAFMTADGRQLDILIDECDSLDMKVLLRHRARQLRIPVVMDTSDRGLLDVERFDLEPERPIFHGLVEGEDLTPDSLKNLSMPEKIAVVGRLIALENASERLKMSLGEIGKTITTWPQLASSVVLGGAVTADVCRRMLLGQYNSSGRYYVDPENIICDN
jgi:molybdopterin/thiamine biosynthesis adenylyltransferase